jgi:hypothetical protein
MKFRIIISITFLFLFAFVCACKKKVAGVGGKNSITGTVLFKNGTSGIQDPAVAAKVSIAYGTNEITTAFDQTVLTDVSGAFKFESLNKGDYFIKAEYLDGNGFSYNNKGVGITFENKKKNLEVNIVLE